MIVLLFVVSGCTKVHSPTVDKARVSVDMFIVTKGQETFKLALVPIKLITHDALASIAETVSFTARQKFIEIRNRREALISEINKSALSVEDARLRALSAQATFDRNCEALEPFAKLVYGKPIRGGANRIEQLEAASDKDFNLRMYVVENSRNLFKAAVGSYDAEHEKLSEKIRSCYDGEWDSFIKTINDSVMAALPIVAQTGADGRATFATKSMDFVLCAQATRAVASEKESYLWIVNCQIPKDGTSITVSLNNQNLTTNFPQLHSILSLTLDDLNVPEEPSHVRFDTPTFDVTSRTDWRVLPTPSKRHEDSFVVGSDGLTMELVDMSGSVRGLVKVIGGQSFKYLREDERYTYVAWKDSVARIPKLR